MEDERTFNTNVMTDFITSTMAASTREEVMANLDRASQAFGMETFAISGIPLPHEKIDPYVVLNAWPEEWFARYSEKNFVHYDPVIYRTKTSNDAFVWSEAFAGRRVGKAAREVMNEATEYGMLDGFSVPLHGIDGLQAIVTFAAQKVDLSQEARGTLQIIAIYAHNRLRALMKEKHSATIHGRMSITRREQELLLWMASGKSAWEAAKILGVAEKTIRNELANLRAKMNVVNTAQLIAESFRLGIIR